MSQCSLTAVLWPLLQGAVSATCNIYSHFILWVCHLVHSKYTYLYTRSTIPFHLRSKKRRIMFECEHCLASCVVTTLHEESYVHTTQAVAAGVGSHHRWGWSGSDAAAAARVSAGQVKRPGTPARHTWTRRFVQLLHKYLDTPYYTLFGKQFKCRFYIITRVHFTSLLYIFFVL